MHRKSAKRYAMSARDKAQKGYMRKMPKREKDKYIQRQLHTRAKIYRYMKRVRS